MANKKLASFVDSTVRFEWELTKEEFDTCEFDQSIDSVHYIIKFGSETSEWMIHLYPKGSEEVGRNEVSIYLNMIKGDKVYEVLYGFAIKTNAGYWPKGDLVEKLYSRRGVDYAFLETIAKDQNHMPGDDFFCTTEEFCGQFVQNKVILVATLVFHMQDSTRYLQQQQVADAYMEDIRSLPLQENFSDVTVICGEKQFPSHRNLLAARSKYFEALFRNEQQKKVVNIVEASPEIVKAMLDFISKGLIPADIDAKAKARDLVMVTDMYRMELLSKVCLSSMVNSLSPDTALDVLITVDKLKHVAKEEHRDEILNFIKEEAAQIVKAANWENFVMTYPSLVTEIVLAACSSKT